MPRSALAGSTRGPFLGIALVVAACGGGGSSPASPQGYTLEVACAGDPFSVPTWATVLLRVRSTDGAAPAVPVPVTLSLPGQTRRVIIPAGRSVWVEDVEGAHLAAGVEVPSLPSSKRPPSRPPASRSRRRRTRSR